MKYTIPKGKAVFMIALMVAIPIYSSMALAALSSGHVYGEDGIKGLTRQGEQINMNITAAINGDSDITPSQLRLGGKSGQQFSNCIAKGSQFICSHHVDSSLLDKNPYQIPIVLYNDEGELDSQYIIRGVIDKQPPEIRSFSAMPQVVSSEDLILSYDIYDHSYSKDDDKCSGISRLEWQVKQLGKQPVSNVSYLNTDECHVTGSLFLSQSILNLEEGSAQVVFTVYDRFGQKASATSAIEVDTTGIDIYQNSVKVTSNGKDVLFLGQQPMIVDISFITYSADLDTDRVYGDFSALNSGNIPSYKNKKASCSQYEEGFRCIFDGIEVKLSSTSTPAIRITAEDLAQNKEEFPLALPVTFDTSGPSVTSIHTNNANYAAKVSDFYVELVENDAGLLAKDIVLDLSSIRSGAVKAADACKKESSNWICVWKNIQADAADGEKTVTVSGTDVLGNALTGTLSAKIMLDRTPPVIEKLEFEPLGTGGQVALPGGYYKTGDAVGINIEAKEINDLRAYIDLSPYLSSGKNISIGCKNPYQDKWICSENSPGIDIPGHIVSQAKITLSDAAGNTVEVKKNLEVFAYNDAKNISHWKPIVACSPSLVDRQVAEMVNTRVYCAVELLPMEQDQETLLMTLGTCTENINGSLSYLEKEPELLNDEKGSTEPFLAIDLAQQKMKVDGFSITCPLEIVSRIGPVITSVKEVKEIDIDLQFYNMPLGEYGEGVQKLIEDAKDDAENTLWKIIGFMKLILKWAELICNALRILNKVAMIFNNFETGITQLHLASIGTPTEPVLDAIREKGCKLEGDLQERAQKQYITLGRVCKFVNCEMSSDTDGKVKAGDDDKSMFKKIGNSFKSWQTAGNDLLGKAPGGGPLVKLITLPTAAITKGQAGSSSDWQGTIEDYTGKQPYQYMNAKDNLAVAVVMGCIPGIINGLDKMRQTQCLYADCLQNNAVNNVPIKTCNDQKSYAQCKYIWGEIFALVPYTAFFDYYVGTIRSAISDPLSAVGIAVSYLKCPVQCSNSGDWIDTNGMCNAVALFSMLGQLIADVEGIIHQYEGMKEDYCKRLKD